MRALFIHNNSLGWMEDDVYKRRNTGQKILKLKLTYDIMWSFIYFKGIYRRFTWGGGIVLKQINYPISMLPILYRSVDRIVKYH